MALLAIIVRKGPPEVIMGYLSRKALLNMVKCESEVVLFFGVVFLWMHVTRVE